jgi:hypothetical protein
VLPVSGLAAGVYLAMLVASFFIGPGTAAADRRLAWGAMLILAGAAAGSAMWFTIVQRWMIGAFCPYCMATHVTGLVLAALVAWRAPVPVDDSGDVAERNDSPGAPRGVIGPMGAGGLAVVGLALAGVLAVCQVAFAPPAAYRGGESQKSSLAAIDPHAVPLVGSPDAQNVVALLFDYKCPHCQKVHSMLDEVIGRYDGKVAFVLCPTPLNTKCNPYVPRDVDEFKDSCELAKVGLAVWVADHGAFSGFDRWMFAPEADGVWRPRSLDAARAKAVDLIGQGKFDAARGDPWIDRYLQTCIRIHGDTIQGGNAVPKLVLGSRWVTPEPNSTDDLVLILNDSLGVPKP